MSDKYYKCNKCEGKRPSLQGPCPGCGAHVGTAEVVAWYGPETPQTFKLVWFTVGENIPIGAKFTGETERHHQGSLTTGDPQNLYLYEVPNEH